MTPPQKQPAVTREEVDAAMCTKSIPMAAEQLVNLTLRPLTERDEAIREVERLRKSEFICVLHDSPACEKCAGDFREENRRTAVYRELAIRVLPVAEEPYRLSRDIRAMKEKAIDSEAQKLLADSGGEKD